MSKRIDDILAGLQELDTEVSIIRAYSDILVEKGMTAIQKDDTDTYLEVLGKQTDMLLYSSELNKKMETLKAAYIAAVAADLLGEGS